MKHLSSVLACVALSLLFSALPTPASAQAVTSPTDPESTRAVDNDAPIELSPFIVSGEGDRGYLARDTLAGTRIRTELKDVGSSISVITTKFLQDTNSTRADDLLVYTPNTEVSGQGGNFLGKGDGQVLTQISTNLNPGTRVRGLTQADNTRDFFLTDIPWDSYNVGRVDLQRGPNSILFGIGSPSGIVNASINSASFKDSYKATIGFGSFGSQRYTLDLNEAIIPDQLAVRVSGLSDQTKYRQDPTFRDDERLYASARWDPGFLRKGSARTSFRASYERGRIDANMPRNTPPLDAITQWFSKIDPNKPAKPTYAGPEVEQSYRQTPGFDRIGNNGTYSVDLQIDSSGSQGFALLPPVDTDIPAGKRYFDIGLGTYQKYAIDAALPGATINAWKARSLTDASIFDFYNHLLEGPNNFQYIDFKAFNAAVTQSFFNDKVGIELAYDRQETKSGGFNYIQANATAISVDIMQTLTFGDPNPFVGRPMFLSAGGSGNWTERTRETLRATAFAELNFKSIMGKDSFLGKVFGRNVVTGLWSRQEASTLSASYDGYFTNQFVSVAANGLPYHAGSNFQGSLRLKNYFGAPITGTTASGLNLQGFKAKVNPVNTTVKVHNYSNGGTDSIALPLVNNVDVSDRDRRYNNGTMGLDQVDSLAAVWQGYWFDGLVVPMIGYRVDEQENRAVTNPPAYTLGTKTLRDIYAPTWVLPAAPNTAKVKSKTYSVVTHLPPSWRNRLPGRMNVSLLYNQSENVQPGASRRDIRGGSVGDPMGDTKEYGVAISALDDRLILKVAHYETRVANATLSDSLASTVGVIGAAERYAMRAYRQTLDLTRSQGPNWVPGATGNVGKYSGQIGQTVYGYADGDPNKPVTWQPDGPAQYAANGTSFNYPNSLLVKAYNEQRAAIADYQANGFITDAAFIQYWLDHATNVDYVQLSDPNFNYTTQSVSNLGGPPGLAVTGDTFSKGYELELTASDLFIDGLQLSVNVSKTTARRMNLAQSFTDWVEARWAVYQGPAGDIRIWGNSVGMGNDDRDDPVNGTPEAHGRDGEDVRGLYKRSVMAPYWSFRELENADVAELKPWAFNVVGNYDFRQGPLRGLSVGGAYRWQDRNVIGFPIKVVNGQETIDVENPYRGSTLGTTDAWVGYSRRLSYRINWRIQLNLRNAFATKDLSKVTANPDGSGAAYRIPEPRTFVITNTFEF